MIRLWGNTLTLRCKMVRLHGNTFTLQCKTIELYSDAIRLQSDTLLMWGKLELMAKQTQAKDKDAFNYEPEQVKG
jgi:hypothetical protein